MPQLQDLLGEKQRYLLQNIQENDLVSFSQFCKLQKGDLNFSSWTYEEIIQLVDKFKIFKQFDVNQQSIVQNDKTHNYKVQLKYQVIQHDSRVQNNEKSQQKISRQYEKETINTKSQQLTDICGTKSTSLSALDLLDLINMPIVTQTQQKKDIVAKKQSQTKCPEVKIENQSKIENTIKNKQIQKKSQLKCQPSIIKKDNSTQAIGQISIKKIKCRKQQLALKQSVSIQINIRKHQIVHKAFFLPDYVMYHIQVSPLNKKCKRNYEDFQRLKSQLIKMYPAIKIPYLQSNSWLSQTSIDFIKKQKYSLQFFLNELIRHPLLKDSQIVNQFLSIQDHKTIKRKFQEYQKVPVPKCLSQLINTDGQLAFQLPQIRQNSQIQILSQFSQKLKQFMGQYYEAALIIYENYQVIVNKLRQMAQLTENMKTVSLNTNKKLNPQNRLKQFPISLKKLEENFFYEYNNLKLKKQIFSEKYFQFLKYQQQNLQGFTCTLQNMKEMAHNLNSLLQEQSVSPSTIQGDKNGGTVNYLKLPKNTGILLASDNIQICKYNLGYVNHMALKQLKWMFQGLGQQLNQKCEQNKIWYLKQVQNLQNKIKSNSSEK